MADGIIIDVEMTDEEIRKMLEDPKIRKLLNDPDINKYKKIADEYGVELISIEEALKGDALIEFLRSTRKILYGVVQMGIRVYERSIPTMIMTVLNVINLGPNAAEKFAVIMKDEYIKLREENKNDNQL
ncbi:MAG: hypothetical protein ACYTEU_13390 [Planctomycetota bacterium]|jgi:hypothetical protein